MVLNLSIELDWIDEDMSIDDVVKQQIISGVMSKVGNQVKDKIEQKINSSIDTLIVKKVNQLTDKMFKDFTKRKITLTDGYGDRLKVYNTLTDYMKRKFDNFLLDTVDEKGNSYDGSYVSKFKRLDFVIDVQLKKFEDEFTTNTVKKVSEEIKKHVADGLQAKLGNELMTVLKVDEMLKLPGKR